MQNAILEQRILRGDEVESAEDRVYRGNRLSAAWQFAGELVRDAVESLTYAPGYKIKPKWSDPLIAPVAEILKYPLIFTLFSPEGFLYGLFALKYSPDNNAYFFPKKKTQLTIAKETKMPLINPFYAPKE